MVRIYITICCLFCSLVQLRAQQHTHILDFPLNMHPDDMMAVLMEKGLSQEDSFELSGRVAGLEAWFYVNVAKDSARINHILLTTQEQQGHSINDDYSTLKKWMQKHYGAPSWEGKVRSHPFARWYIAPDHDIVLIATATAGVEIWFYENHLIRNVDYYSILKYCERNPAPGLPHLTAKEQVTWKSTGPGPSVKKRVVKRHRHGHKSRSKVTKNKRRSKAKRPAKRRRRR